MEQKLLQQLYEAYGTEIRQYLHALSKNPGLAEELCQETFYKAIISLPESHTNMRAWLYMVARNLYFSYRKREKRQMFCREGAAADTYEPGMPKVHSSKSGSSSSAPDVLEQVLANERNQMLYQALLALPERKREVIALQYFGGFKLREIAQLLGISPENARVLSSRAKRELREFLEVKGYDIS